MSRDADASTGFRRALVLAHSGHQPFTALRLLQEGGCQSIERRDLDRPASLANVFGYDLALVDLTGCPAPQLAGLLSRVEALDWSPKTRVVVAIAAAQIDAAEYVIFNPRMVVLCDPSPEDWSLAIEAHDATPERVQDWAHEERKRLLRLSEEATRVAKALEELSGSGRGSDEAVSFEGVAIAPAEVRAVIRARRLRDEAFPSGLFADPAWDILLDLLLSHLEQQPVSISSACIASSVPPTTGLRWIAALERAKLVERRADHLDRRRTWVLLSQAGLVGLRKYLAALRAANLPLA